mmetsp:Transcript_19507/g.54410  ORF Transcript_19507/g.54410 Transcript_19507/m.54410 type:complete len:416 (+) Transcript_19507:970-2217(+)
MRLIQLTIVTDSIAPIIRSFRIRVVLEVIVISIEIDVQRRVVSTSETIVPLAGTRPITTSRSGIGPPRCHLEGSRHVGLSHRGFEIDFRVGLDGTWLHLKNIDFGRTPSDSLGHSVMGNSIAGRHVLSPKCFFCAKVGGKWPNVLGTSYIGVARQVPQQPKRWPQSTNVALARHRSLCFDNTTRETKLVPGLQHCRFKMFRFSSLLFRIFFVFPNNESVGGFGCNDELTIIVGSCICYRIIVQRSVGVIVLFESGPSWITSVCKGTPGHVELFGKYEFVRTRSGRGISRGRLRWCRRGPRRTSCWGFGSVFLVFLVFLLRLRDDPRDWSKRVRESNIDGGIRIDPICCAKALRRRECDCQCRHQQQIHGKPVLGESYHCHLVVFGKKSDYENLTERNNGVVAMLLWFVAYSNRWE